MSYQLMSSPSSVIRFPFERNKTYTVGDLRAFERALSATRQEDHDLSGAWRVPPKNNKRMQRWAKLREETYPIKLLADHKSYPDDAAFRLMPDGNPGIDAEIRTANEGFNLEITIADPIWADDGDKVRHGGYDHRLLMEALNKNSVVIGSGKFRRSADGKIVSDQKVRSFEQEFEACANGLRAALARKWNYGGLPCRLLIYARTYFSRTIHFSFENVVNASLADFLTRSNAPPFETVYFVDQGPKNFVEVPNS